MRKDKTPHIVLGVTGSIAAYKACEIVRLCVKRGWTVQVAMTPAAEEFVTRLTFATLSKNTVASDMFSTTDFKPEHISLADAADVFVIAPCTADIIAKIAHGIADDIVTTTFLATKSPIIVAPAMNVNMWENAATVDNVKTLKSRGVSVLGTETGELACGTTGAGRMLPPETIVSAIAAALNE